MFSLIIEDKHGSVADEYTFEDGEFLIGRSQSADIILPSDNVSRRHARLYTVDGRCYVEDLGSSNGVFVNGRRIHEVFQIQRAAQIKVGDYYLHIEGEDAGGDEEKVYCILTGQNLGFAGQVYTVNRNVTLIGRGKDCTLTLIDPSISRIHSKLTVDRNGALLLEDLKSSNGTFLNNERIEVANVNHGDLIRIGNAEFICEVPATGASGGFGTEAHYGDYGESSSRRGLWIVLGIVLTVLALGAVGYVVWGDQIFGDGGTAPSEQVEGDKDDKGDKGDKGKKKAGKDDDDDAKEAKERSDKLEELVEAGTEAVKKRKWTEALEAWQGVKDLDPLNSKAQKAINQIKTWNKHAEALTSARKLEKDKKYAEAARKLREVLRDESSVYLEDAQKVMKGLMDMKPTLALQADANADAKDCDKLDAALADYKNILAIDPRDEGVADKIKQVEDNRAKQKCGKK